MVLKGTPRSVQVGLKTEKLCDCFAIAGPIHDGSIDIYATARLVLLSILSSLVCVCVCVISFMDKAGMFGGSDMVYTSTQTFLSCLHHRHLLAELMALFL